MVKVGDNLIVTGKTGHFIPVGSKVTVVEVNNGPTDRDCRVESEIGLRQWVCNDDLRKFSPPEKITQNGYEYSLVGPVKPEWLVDCAWVVREDNGETHQIHQQSDNCFSATSSFSRTTGLTAKMVSEEFRPHTASDWKWGDWAVYNGKRVFVVGGVDNTGRVLVSYPDIYPLGEDDADRNFLYVPTPKLTPTF